MCIDELHALALQVMVFYLFYDVSGWILEGYFELFYIIRKFGHGWALDLLFSPSVTVKKDRSSPI